jgi:hypothetical protein
MMMLMRSMSLAIVLTCLAVPAAAEDVLHITTLMKTYYVCLAGNGAAAMHFKGVNAADAFDRALYVCAAEEDAVRKMIPLIPHEQGELNEADSVQDSVRKALIKLEAN